MILCVFICHIILSWQYYMGNSVRSMLRFGRTENEIEGQCGTNNSNTDNDNDNNDASYDIIFDDVHATPNNSNLQTDIILPHFDDDYNMNITSGPHRGKKLMDVPEEYVNWILTNVPHGAIYEANVRIKNRRNVENIVKKHTTQPYIPNIMEAIIDLQPLSIKDDAIDFMMFSSFIEYFIKYHMGIKKHYDATIYLAMYGLCEVPTVKKSIDKIDQRARCIQKSYNKVICTPSDLCNLSFAKLINEGTFDEKKANDLYKYVLQNEQKFSEYKNKFKSTLQQLHYEQQITCNNISVGCLVGELGALSDTESIDMKCYKTDDIEYYRRLLFARACLHRLRYGKMITSCKIINCMTGKIYVMDISNVTNNTMMQHIKNMGSYCDFHVKLFV